MLIVLLYYANHSTVLCCTMQIFLSYLAALKNIFCIGSFDKAHSTPEASCSGADLEFSREGVGGFSKFCR